MFLTDAIIEWKVLVSSSKEEGTPFQSIKFVPNLLQNAPNWEVASCKLKNSIRNVRTPQPREILLTP